MSETAPRAVLPAVRLAAASRKIGLLLNGASQETAVMVVESPPPIPPEVIQEAKNAAAQQGFEAGFAEGKLAADREWQAQKKRFEQMLRSIAEKRDDLLEVLEDDFVEVIAEGLGHVLTEPAIRRQLILDAVRRATRALADAQVLTVRIAPQDRELLGEGGTDAFADISAKVRVVADAQVRLGGCVVETGRGSLDARLERLFEKVQAALLEAKRPSHDSPAPTTNQMDATER